ncbi:MAG: DUF839 domain-containing protein [Cytophagales bacterium]
MRKVYTFIIAMSIAFATQAQFNFPVEVTPTWGDSLERTSVLLPPSPLKFQVLFIGGHDKVQTTATYGNGAGEAVAKQWHDFIGFTPDNNSSDLGWVSVNHEMIVQNDSIGDGGGMTVFKIARDPNTDTLVIVSQTLTDGRSGNFFNVDFANTVGETGMNCGGITSSADGRIWTAEEWFRTSNSSIDDRDTSDFIIGADGTDPGIAVAQGKTVKKYENYNWMVEIDPMEAVAVRKQYNWGRQGFEGGCVLPDNQTVYLGEDGTPGWFSKFVATTPGDFTSGTLYVYKHDDPNKWVQIDNTNWNNMLNYKDAAVAANATMFNRIEWVTYAPSGKVYFTETGRDNPGSRWRDEAASGALYNPNTLARATAQSTSPDSSDYVDYYGRVWVYDPITDTAWVHIEGGPDLADGTTAANYPNIHLTNPDGLNTLTVNGKTFLLICEDLNGSSYGRVPAEEGGQRTCELYLLDESIANPTYNDLVRISATPFGAEITGAIGLPDGKSILVNSQHPSSTDNQFPYNNSLTYAITGWDQAVSSLTNPSFEGQGFQIYPNPTSRELLFNEVSDVAVYTVEGKRIRVFRGVNKVDVSDLESGVYLVMNQNGQSKKLVVE